MSTTITPAPTRTGLLARSSFVQLGLLFGIVMPLVAAAVYPTYTHEMHPAWIEYTRLIELPFVIAELLVVHVAIRRGYDDATQWRALPRDIRIALGLLAIGATVSSVFISRNVPYSLSISLITVVHLRFAAALFFLFRAEPRPEVDRIVPLLGVGVLCLVVLTVWRVAFPPPLSAIPGGVLEWFAAMPGFISVRHLGSWSGAVAAGLALAMLYGDRSRYNVLCGLYFIAAACTVWSGTRAAVLAVVVVVAIAAATLRRLPPLRTCAEFVGLSLLTLPVSLLLRLPDNAFALYVKGDLKNTSAVTGARSDLWLQTFHRWLDSPLFGWGSGSTFWEVNIGWAHTQPHNVVLQLLISWGLVGAAGGLWLLARGIHAAHAHGFGRAELRPLAGVTYALLFMSLLEGMLHYPRFISMILIGLAAILADRSRASI